jgi:hypothetical protein
MDKQEQPRDKALDVPSEANRDKNINFAESQEAPSENTQEEHITPKSSDKSADEYGEIARKTIE